MAERNKRTYVVVSHTHWDREWHLPFEAFRARLVAMLDRLLDLLDRDPEYRHFVLDGQTIALDDYLEVRPERRADIERHVRAGRLLIGPNYMLPDEFLIGGESWVRNLQIGIRSAREFGPVMMVGYSPDAFGHIAHLPAILRGFGIDSVVLWRGVGRRATRSEFLWRAPDGSELFVLHFPFGYGIAAQLPTDPQALRSSLAALRGQLEPLATSRYVLLPNGNDHAPPQESLPRVLRAANGLFDDAEFVHGHYPMLIEAMRRELGDDGLPRLEGEFRSSERSNVLAGVLSARMWIKQRYQECEDLLARRAEPLSAWAHLLRRRNGGPVDKGASELALLRLAWKLLLQNGPHDSVCGCSIDQVHEEMRTRFDRCQQLGEAVLYESQRYIGGLASPAGGPGVAVFNSENGPRSDFCTVRLPVEDGKLPARLVDADGRRVELQILERGLRSPLDRPVAPPRIRVTERGPARHTLEIALDYALPTGLARDSESRSRRWVRCPIVSRVRLYPGVARIDIETIVDNRAKDHRLRAHFPTGVKSDVAHAEQHFGVVTRNIELPEADMTWCETPSGYEPQKTFVDINDGHGGMMIANRGLHEYEALPGRAGVTIALTLLRCVGWLSRGDLSCRNGHAGPPLETPGAQEIGTSAFEYAIIPHEGGWHQAYAEAHRFAVPMRARWNQQGSGLLPASASLLDVEGKGLVVTAVKRPDQGEGAIVRLYNTLDRATTGRLRLAERWSRAQVVDMKEDELSAAEVLDGWVGLKLRPNEIVTLRFS